MAGKNMATENAVLMAQARKSLQGRWGLAVGGVLIYYIVSFIIGFVPILGVIASLILTGPLVLGFTYFMMTLAREQEARIEQIFDGFKLFGPALATYLLMAVFVFLWTLLLIIPGIIAAFNYSMSFYILADDNSLSATEAIDRSKAMMNGHKWKLFCLGCRFIGWALLCTLTIGIGFLWLAPYAGVSMVKFYDDIKPKPEALEPVL